MLPWLVPDCSRIERLVRDAAAVRAMQRQAKEAQLAHEERTRTRDHYGRPVPPYGRPL